MTLKLHQLGKGEGGADSECLPHLSLPSTRHIILQIIHTAPIPTQVAFTTKSNILLVTKTRSVDVRDFSLQYIKTSIFKTWFKERVLPINNLYVFLFTRHEITYIY